MSSVLKRVFFPFVAGAMAGLAIGMILLGILLSVGATFVFHRYKTSGKAPAVDMKRLDEQESET